MTDLPEPDGRSLRSPARNRKAAAGRRNTTGRDPDQYDGGAAGSRGGGRPGRTCRAPATIQHPRTSPLKPARGRRVRRSPSPQRPGGSGGRKVSRPVKSHTCQFAQDEGQILDSNGGGPRRGGRVRPRVPSAVAPRSRLQFLTKLLTG